MLRRRSEPDPPEPAASVADTYRAWAATLEPRWRAPVDRAAAAHERFVALAAQVPAGPTRDWLMGVGPTLDQTVQRVADAVHRAARAQVIAAGLDPATSTAELKAARRELDTARSSGAGVEAAEARVQLLADRHRAVNEALNLAEDALPRLDELNVRLETVVARATAIVLRSADDGGVADLDAELRSVVDGLSALDAALGEVGGA